MYEGKLKFMANEEKYLLWLVFRNIIIFIFTNKVHGDNSNILKTCI